MTTRGEASRICAFARRVIHSPRTTLAWEQSENWRLLRIEQRNGDDTVSVLYLTDAEIDLIVKERTE